MAKKSKDKPANDKNDDRDALEEVMAKARQKMKESGQKQSAANLDDQSQFREGAQFDKQVEEREIDPTAKKALKDLLGADIDSEQAKNISSVKIYSPFRVYYDGPAASVSALNRTGPFDILPGHKNFLTLLLPGDVVVRSPSGKEERITIDRGIMHVRADNVRVFLDV